jgi:hypothetical protein
MNETQRCQSLLPELRMLLLWFIEGATSPSMTLTELSQAKDADHHFAGETES